jgi:hypothetical protein
MYVPSWDLSNPRYKTENKRKQIKHADTKWTEQNEMAHNETKWRKCALYNWKAPYYRHRDQILGTYILVHVQTENILMLPLFHSGLAP